MYKINVNDQFNFETDIKNGVISADGKEVAIDLIAVGQDKFHLIYHHKSYEAEVLEVNHQEKKFKIKVENHIYELDIKDKYDQLLQNLGLDKLNTHQIKEIKAPMPGLVLKVLVNEGDVVAKGENLFILEAMKMENMIKATADMTIKKINIKPGDKVEKNQILILLD